METPMTRPTKLEPGQNWGNAAGDNQVVIERVEGESGFYRWTKGAAAGSVGHLDAKYFLRSWTFFGGPTPPEASTVDWGRYLPPREIPDHAPAARVAGDVLAFSLATLAGVVRVEQGGYITGLISRDGPRVYVCDESFAVGGNHERHAVLICRAGETPPPPEEVWERAYGWQPGMENLPKPPLGPSKPSSGGGTMEADGGYPVACLSCGKSKDGLLFVCGTCRGPRASWPKTDGLIDDWEKGLRDFPRSPRPAAAPEPARNAVVDPALQTKDRPGARVEPAPATTPEAKMLRGRHNGSDLINDAIVGMLMHERDEAARVPPDTRPRFLAQAQAIHFLSGAVFGPAPRTEKRRWVYPEVDLDADIPEAT